MSVSVFMVSCEYNVFTIIRDVVSTWSSGTGGAGIIGALSYTVLIDLKLTSQQAMLIFLYVPTLEALAFWLLLRHPKEAIVRTEAAEMVVQDVLTVKEKMIYFFKDLLPFFVPLSLVYFAEYFINMGLVRKNLLYLNFFHFPFNRTSDFSLTFSTSWCISRIFSLLLRLNTVGLVRTIKSAFSFHVLPSI